MKLCCLLIYFRLNGLNVIIRLICIYRLYILDLLLVCVMYSITAWVGNVLYIPNVLNDYINPFKHHPYRCFKLDSVKLVNNSHLAATHSIYKNTNHNENEHFMSVRTIDFEQFQPCLWEWLKLTNGDIQYNSSIKVIDVQKHCLCLHSHCGLHLIPWIWVFIFELFPVRKPPGLVSCNALCSSWSGGIGFHSCK